LPSLDEIQADAATEKADPALIPDDYRIVLDLTQEPGCPDGAG
jgi:hypothetical protein